jgi:hypothetical protein
LGGTVARHHVRAGEPEDSRREVRTKGQAMSPLRSRVLLGGLVVLSMVVVLLREATRRKHNRSPTSIAARR